MYAAVRLVTVRSVPEIAFPIHPEIREACVSAIALSSGSGNPPRTATVTTVTGIACPRDPGFAYATLGVPSGLSGLSPRLPSPWAWKSPKLGTNGFKGFRGQ